MQRAGGSLSPPQRFGYLGAPSRGRVDLPGEVSPHPADRAAPSDLCASSVTVRRALRPPARVRHQDQEPTMTLFRTARAALPRLTLPALFAAFAPAILPRAAPANELALQTPHLDPAHAQ